MSCLLGVAVTSVYHFFLPDIVAIHFGFTGQANSWASRNVNTLFWIILFLFTSGFFGFVIPFLVKKLPPSLINIPHRDYWLAAERRDKTIAGITSMMHWFAAALNVYMMLIQAVVFFSIITNAGRLNIPLFLAAVAAFLAFVGIWLSKLIGRFRRPAY